MKNYSVRKNMGILLRILWKQDQKVMISMWLHIFTGTIVPLIGVVIPSVIIYLLMHDCDILSFAWLCGLLLLGYGLLQGCNSYLQEYNNYAFIRPRLKYFIKKISLTRAQLDLMVLEDSEHKKMLEDAESAVGKNTDGVEGMYHDFIVFMTAFLGLLLYALTSTGVSIWMVLILLVLVFVQYICFVKARNYENAHRDEMDEYLIRAKYLNQLAYNPSAGKDIRLYQLQDWINLKFQYVNNMMVHIKRKDYGAYMLVDTIAILLDFFRDIICYGFLIYRLIQGMPIDQFVFYLGIISGFSIWFKQAGEAYAHLSQKNVLVNRMWNALDIQNVLHHGDGEKIQGSDVTIAFDHVSFHYPNQERMILDDVSFTLHSQEKLALVGGNGAGKSTIVKLILGFYVPTSGSVLINGIDTRKIDIEDIYHHITGIFQNSTLLSYTIAENVSMKDIAQTDVTRVRRCLKQAGLWEKIETLPEQELTYIGKDIVGNGIRLSGGQIQKLLMARALYHEFSCLLLDEPTAALDALAEKELYCMKLIMKKHWENHLYLFLIA